MTPGGCSGSALQSSLFRNNGRAREAKPLFSQHLHSLSDRWALRINSLCVLAKCWACSLSLQLASLAPVDPVAATSVFGISKSPAIIQSFAFSPPKRQSRVLGGLLLWEVCHIQECPVTPIEWQIYLTMFDKWVVCDSLTEGVICKSDLKAWPSESND